MTIQFNPSKTAVLSLHMVNDVVLKEGKFGNFFGEQAKERDVIEKGKQLIKAARSSQIPIIHVAVRFQPGHPDLVANSPLLSMVKEMDALVDGTWGGDFVEGLQPLENEIVISHQRIGPFYGTELGAILKKNGFESLILFGVATNIVVESTARMAGDEGYNIFVVEDCCSAATLEAHQASLGSLGLLTNIVKLNDIFQVA